ncbi:MAG: sugar phosphate nucleotidyltransferase [Aquisalimonadaceae bacterium]
MKVVLFCGGLGTRLREYSETMPKPLVPVGDRPIIWNIMKYYAHYGHKDFILCLGYRGDLIKDYFLKYNECMTNDFLLRSGREVELVNQDLQDWNIMFVDTGLHANIGSRLMAVKHLLEGEEYFLANYSDGLSDLPLDQHIQEARTRRAVASFLSVRPSHTFHPVSVDEDGLVTGIEAVRSSNLWINGGFFVLNKAVFNFMEPGDELVEAPFQRLIREKKLVSYQYGGFWASMDTFKDKKMFDAMCDVGQTPWQVWRS